jgi:hypothetical protein
MPNEVGKHADELQLVLDHVQGILLRLLREIQGASRGGKRTGNGFLVESGVQFFRIQRETFR